MICQYFSNTCIFTSCATGHSPSLTAAQETGGAIKYYHGPCPSWSCLGAHLAASDLTLPMNPAQAGWRRWEFACVLPCLRDGEAEQHAWEQRTPWPVLQFRQSLVCPARCELQYHQLLKRSPYSKARVKVLNALVLAIPESSKPPTEHLLSEFPDLVLCLE